MKRMTWWMVLVLTAVAYGASEGQVVEVPSPVPGPGDPFGPGLPLRPANATNPKPGAEAETETAAIEPDRKPAAPLPPNFMTFHLLDGNIISGDLSIDEITVTTQFGKLVVPIEKIRSFKPGLDSYPQIAGEIEQLIQNLGVDDYKTRENSHKELLAKGEKVRSELERHAASENAEIKRHIGEILKELNEQADEADDEDASPKQPWVRLDTVVTTDFTVTGKVSPSEFQLNSKYGPLTVALADIDYGQRELDVKEELRKTVSVTGENLAQRSFKSSGVRVQAGDKITIKAEGTISMSPWGSRASSGPDGAPNYGWYIPNQIPGGALVAKVGDGGTIFKVGRQSTFTAKASGVLQFAIGMQGEYSQGSYQFPGEYRLRIRVEPR